MRSPKSRLRETAAFFVDFSPKLGVHLIALHIRMDAPIGDEIRNMRYVMSRREPMDDQLVIPD